LPLTELFDFQIRADYHSLNGTLSATETTEVLGPSGTPVLGAFQHTLIATLATIGIEPMLGIRVIGDLYVHAGLSAGILVSKKYSQQEEIIQPDGGGTFEDSNGNDTHSRVRNNLSGTIPNASSFQLAALGGISYMLPLNRSRTLFLAPEIFYNFGITKIASDLTWRVNSIRAGIALMFSPEKKEVHPAEITQVSETHIETPPLAKKYALESSVAATGVGADGRESPIASVTVEEFSSTMMTPLLNYVFFDENSSEIPARYYRIPEDHIDTFAIEHIHSADKLSTYHNILNIVGERLYDNANTIMTLTGCNEDDRQEKGNIKLSRARAEAVRKYFIDVWRINPNRLIVQTRNLSAKAAIPGTPDADQENRRVELASPDPKILFPVITDDTLRISNPPIIRFRPSAKAEAGAASWALTAFQGARNLKQFEGKGVLPQLVDWKLDESSMPRVATDVRYDLTVKDSLGNSTLASHAISIEQITIRKKREERRGDTVINRFSLILFDVGSAEITSANAPIVQLIKDYIKPLSKVTISGYTDRLGDPAYNVQLSERRAQALAAALSTKNISSKGLGQADLYDASLPEGRLYTRTVDVVIETPTQN